MRSGSEEGSYSRLIDFVYHSTLGLRVMKKKRCRRVCVSLNSRLERNKEEEVSAGLGFGGLGLG
jgi:hypothetical protein